MTKRETLANCYRNSLQLAVENEIKTIAFPAISCGAYGYPIEEAAHIAFKTTREFLAMSDEIQKVIFVVWGEDVYDAYRRFKYECVCPNRRCEAYVRYVASIVQRLRSSFEISCQHFSRETQSRLGIR